MSSTVMCRASSTVWAVNSVGQDVCKQYAALLGLCDPNFSLAPLTPSSPPYLPTASTAACACNLVAYNLAAACRWCQDTLQPLWWATRAEWTERCTSVGYSFSDSGLPRNISGAGITISEWAREVAMTNGTWDPTLIGVIVAANNPSQTSAVPVIESVAGTSTSSASTGASSGTEIPIFTGQPSGGLKIEPKDVALCVLGSVILAFSIGFIVALVVCRRRRRRQARLENEALCFCECHMSVGTRPGHSMCSPSTLSMLPQPIFTSFAPGGFSTPPQSPSTACTHERWPPSKMGFDRESVSTKP